MELHPRPEYQTEPKHPIQTGSASFSTSSRTSSDEARSVRNEQTPSRGNETLMFRLTRWRIKVMTLFAVVTGFLLLHNSSHSIQWKRQVNDSASIGFGSDDYLKIPSSTTLQWHRCFDEDFYCARLEVPMNHRIGLEADSSDHSTVEVAMIMLPGTNRTGNLNYSVAPLIVNPGGPGASGVEFLRNLGHEIQAMAGHDRDIVSFDPRGVGFTKPTADCYTFPTSGNPSTPDESDITRGRFNRLQFALSNEAVGLVNSTEGALMQRDSAARAVAQLCKQKDDHDGERSILRYLDTQSVARDMLCIIDAWDEWLETLEARTTLQTNAKVTERPKAMLNFLGFSYGTLLGATFATMFPDRIGRMVLDGVVDAVSSSVPFASEPLEDADAVHDMFFKYCSEAGPRKCAAARDGDHANDVAKRVKAALQSLREQPLVGVHPATKTPSIITWSMLKGAIFGSLYSPVTSFPLIAQIYDYLHRGDHKALHASIPQLHSMIRRQSYCSPLTWHSFDPGDAQSSIRCSDQNRLNATIPELLQSYESLSRVSSFADIFMNVGLPCNGWSIQPINPPLWTTDPDHWNETSQINTSFPLLFVSNTYDPITPLRAGIGMAQRFHGAGFIEQEGEGHCSIVEISFCTISKVRAYLRDGIVPPAPKLKNGEHVREGIWERCETDEWPWQPLHGQDEVGSAYETQRPWTRSGVDEPGSTEQQNIALVRAWKHVQEYMTTGTIERPRFDITLVANPL